WSDEVTNIGGTRATMQMLYHTNIGEPVLRPGSELVAPVQTVAPSTSAAADDIANWSTCGPGAAGAGELVYFCELAADAAQNTHVLLKNPAGDEGVSLRWNLSALPHFILWKNPVAGVDGYVTGLEPATNFPNPRKFE